MSTVAIRPKGVPVTPRQRRESLAGVTVDSSDTFVPKWLSVNPDTHSTIPASQRHQKPRYLEVSPYHEQEHLLDLNTVDTVNRLFAQALVIMEPVTPKYAVTPYHETFNWPTVFAALRVLAKAEGIEFPETEFYVVEFRSQLQENIDNYRLGKLDKESHREATIAGGLLKYWFGSPDAHRRNLATCLWRGKEDAIEGGKGMWHAQARQIISTTYESIDVTGLRLVVGKGAQDWKFEPWSFH